MKRTHSLSLALAILAGSVALPASAQWYAGASVGRSEVSSQNAITADQFLDLGFESAAITRDKNGTAVRLFGGYQLNKYAALEAAYVDLGKFSFRADVLPPGALIASTKINGFELAALGTLPLSERFGVFAKVGALIGETKTSYSGSGSVEVLTTSLTQTKRSSQLIYGAGASFAINSKVSLRAEWIHYTKLGNELTGGRTDADFYGLGVTYRF